MSDLRKELIGKYVICRSRNEGINAGFLKAADESGCILTQVRRLWYHKPATKEKAWYEGVSEVGLSEDSRISCIKDWKLISEDYSLTSVTERAQKSIMGASEHGQT